MALIDQAMDAIAKLRRDGARVHCITNTVAQYFTANVLLACGAVPSMTASPEESRAFTESCDALLINLGTLDGPRREAILASLEAARAAGKPVLLDPVKCDLSPSRLEFAKAVLGDGGVILKANARESQCLSDAATACRITTGEIDRVEYQAGKFSVANGTGLMDRTIATGCALGALIAALATKAEEPHVAAAAGLVWFGVAGELATEQADGQGVGPGLFPALLIDRLAAVDIDTIRERARLQ